MAEEAAPPPAATPVFRARCLCGEFVHEMTGAPMAVVVCHCTTCRAYSGAPYLHTAAWLGGSVKRVSGHDENLLSFKCTDAFARTSCRKCGSYVAGHVEAYGMLGFQLGTIEDAYENNTYRPVFRPQCHLFYGSRVVDVPDGAPKMRKKAPEDGMMGETEK
jgi:hypothetical protein